MFFSNANNERGSALVIISGIILILSGLMAGALSKFDVGLQVFRSFNEQKQTFYMSEGVRNLATVLMQSFFQTNPSPTGAEVSVYLNAKLPPLIPAPYTVSPITVEILKNTPNGTISSGPYAGMNGPVIQLSLKFSVNAPSSVFNGNIVAPLSSEISIAYISMFQFMVFYDTTTAFLQTGPDLFVKGRLHANGDLCIGSDGGWDYFLKVTVGQRLMSNNDARCGPAVVSHTKIATDSTFTQFADMTSAYDNGCTNCAGTGLNWQAFSLARWHQQALDQANGVQSLILPGTGTGLVQLSQAGNWAAVNNGGNLRFIVDPVLPTDTPVVQSYKFARNSDLRIINGVWYLKDPTSPGFWPGVPIWSDHPGRFTENGMGVGQDDIRDRWAGTFPWPATPATPTGFSYYAFDSANQTLFQNTPGEGVLSYGNMFAGGAAPSHWIPGDWVNAAAASPFCIAGAAISCGGGACGLLNPWVTTPTCAGAATPGRDPGYASQILNATRGGFVNGHIYMISPGTAAQKINRSKMLPVNFDVNQFQVALTNGNPGELGSYFGAGSFMRSDFNGIVYITSIWPGGATGFGAGGPTEFKFNGAIADPNQIGATDPNVQQALPQPLCSNNVSLGQPASAYASTAFDSQGPPATPVVRFNVPDCAAYSAAGAIQAFPDVVRLVNAANLNGAILSSGLSIVSNLPVYMTGDYNTSSNVASATSSPWVSSLVAGDKVTYLSNAWDDAKSGWSQNPNAFARAATNTTYNTALITEPSTNLSVLLEDWTGRNLTLNGSVVMGYNAVYALHQNYCCANVSYQPPNRTFNFDQHFGFINNQPPGTPVFPISAVLLWTNSQ